MQLRMVKEKVLLPGLVAAIIAISIIITTVIIVITIGIIFLVIATSIGIITYIAYHGT